MSAPPLSLRLYRAAMGLAEPLAPLLLKRRARRGKEAPDRLGERLGRAGQPRPAGALVWLHGASVGEGLSLLPLVERIAAERPDLRILITSGTRTSAELIAARLPPGAIHQYVPIDTPGAVGRFLAHWRPGLGLFVESELWPNLILDARRGGVRLALVSARMTEASARGWARRPRAARAVLGAFDAILAQDAVAEARITALGGRVTGRLNLKRLGSPVGADSGEVAALKRAIGERRVILAASTHPGEETPLAAAVRALAGDPLLVIAPRHPERGGAIATELRKAGFAVVQRSKTLHEPEDFQRVDVYLADTLGEMGLLYRLADALVMGGSFVGGVGGHNPLEGARLGLGVLTGPHVFNYDDIYGEMAAGGAAVIVNDPVGLGRELAGPERLRELGGKARAFAAAQGQGFESGWRAILPLLPAP